MNKIEKLIQELCPNGVEWKSLGEVLPPKGYIRGPFGSALKKAFFVTNGIPVYEQRHAIYDKRNFRYFIDNDRAETLSRFKVRPNDLIISCSGTIGKISIISQHDKIGVINQALLILRLDLLQVNIKYIKFYFECNIHLLLSNTGGAITNIEKRSVIEKIQIPIPPLKIQKEIVRILDTFTEHTAELTAELTARKKQYSYYREQFFSFDNNEVQHLPMGHDSIGKFIRGGGLQKKDFTESGVGCIHYGQLYTYYGTYTDKTKSFVSLEFAKKARMAEHGDLVIATTSENDEDLCKAVAWLGDKEIAVSSDACFYTHKLNPKYVAYFFQTEQFHKQKMPFITGAKVRRVNADNLAKIKIPIPSPEEQARIVSILDKFDTLTTSISEGLPKEIELRKKQYEYYRDMLLTFPINNFEE